MLATKGNRCKVKVLKGGFERFSAEYPFLRTQKIMYTILELEKLPRYPAEILPLSLYLGDRSHAYNAALNYNMKIAVHVNVAAELYPAYPATISTLHVPAKDEESEDLLQRFEEVCEFIGKHVGSSKRVLVFGELGISRSATACIAFLMKHSKLGLKEAFAHVRSQRPQIRPLTAFVRQLSNWEEHIFGEKKTDISEPISF
jgi:serine/threonine/tyrosine-interacting-like protein 1